MSTIISSTISNLKSLMAFVDVRCRRCNRLIVRWLPTGVAQLEAKCARCGLVDVIVLTT